MSGMIGVVGDYAARYTWFSQCLGDLDKPDGTDIKWRMGGNQAKGRNLLIRDCLDAGHEWLFFVDDDHAFVPNVLTRLLSHGYPVVSALVLLRGSPFLPAAFAAKHGDHYLTLDLDSVGHDNLVQVRACGTGALLVRSDVFRQLDEPWFVYNSTAGEDLYFSDRLHEAEIPILVDTGCRVGHIAPAAVFADWDGRKWNAVFRYADGTAISQPLDHRKEN